MVDEEKQSGIGCANNCFNDDQVLAPKDRSILYNVWLICLKTHSFIKAGFFFAAVLYMPTLLCFPSTTQIQALISLVFEGKKQGLMIFRPWFITQK